MNTNMHIVTLTKMLIILCNIFTTFTPVSAGDCKTKFVKVDLCPVANNSHEQLQQSTAGTGSEHCAIICNRKPHCHLFHFNSINKICYQGNSSCQGLELWETGPCESFRLHDDNREIPFVDKSTCEMIKNLSLKLLYRFTTHGLVNLVDESKYKLTNHNVIMDSVGAHFKGNQHSYLITETPGFEKIVGNGNEYSFFAVARDRMNGSHTLGEFIKCDRTQYADFLYTSRAGKLAAAAYKTLDDTRLKAFSPVLVPSTSLSSLHYYSAGSTFRLNSFENFYFNGSYFAKDTQNHENLPSAYDSSVLQCLFIGCDVANDIFSKEGSMFCFALSQKALTSDEFLILDKWCSLHR